MPRNSPTSPGQASGPAPDREIVAGDVYQTLGSARDQLRVDLPPDYARSARILPSQAYQLAHMCDQRGGEILWVNGVGIALRQPVIYL